jgi:putative FmdB family regulatory protein
MQGFPPIIAGRAPGHDMPIYAYRCGSCGHEKDVIQKFSDAPLTVCPSCGADAFRKQLTAPAFQLKGTGWYVTDFRDAKQGKGAKPAGDGEAAPSDASAKPDGAATKSEGASAKSEGASAKPDGAPAAAKSDASAAKPSDGGGVKSQPTS